MNMEDLLKIKNIYNNIPNEVKKARKSFFNNGNRANRLYIYYGIDDIEKLLMKIKNYGLKVLRCMVTKKKMMHGCQNFFML